MVEIFGSKDCGNSPKNKLIENIGIALEVGDVGYLEQLLSEEAVWELSNGNVIEGSELLKILSKSNHRILSINIDHVMSHGKVGSVNGAVSLAKNQQSHFCHIIEFSSIKCEKIKRVCTYCKS